MADKTFIEIKKDGEVLLPDDLHAQELAMLIDRFEATLTDALYEDHRVDTDRPSVTSDVTVYGRLIRVGGVAQPIVWLELANGQVLACRSGQALARELAPRLYQVVGLQGRGTWLADDTATLQRFHAERITPFQDGSLMEAMQELADLSEGVFDEIEDVEAFLDELRD